jgi:hypothetical protein
LNPDREPCDSLRLTAFCAGVPSGRHKQPAEYGFGVEGLEQGLGFGKEVASGLQRFLQVVGGLGGDPSVAGVKRRHMKAAQTFQGVYVVADAPRRADIGKEPSAQDRVPCEGCDGQMIVSLVSGPQASAKRPWFANCTDLPRDGGEPSFQANSIHFAATSLTAPSSPPFRTWSVSCWSRGRIESHTGERNFCRPWRHFS